MTDTGRAIADVDELARESELMDVRYYELVAKRRDGFVEQGKAPEDPSMETQVLQRVSEQMFEVRCRANVEAPDASYVADIGVTFSIPRNATVSNDIITEFAERVGIMTAHPFIRESVHTLSGQIRARRLLLNLMRPGKAKLVSRPVADLSFGHAKLSDE